ncbi:MAG TPA: HNH endonuclease [Nocardioides sp.]|jgi:5-methylcytosine-specific restriction endonuclease McrA|uniref:HNH endonuclease signature motif containing protein n=1 Tax=Nocardioides sp. TaxID=35761 RepID=UPI002CB637E3|nr:HNH endonuclease [Nocardioides sp.]HTW17818.1 HNH endonuclease [Nocardioides sp.]
MGTWRKYTPELLADAVAQSTSVAGVLRHLGLIQAGGTHAHISRMIKRFEIDTSHFVRSQRGAARVRLTATQILIRTESSGKRTKPPLLRRALAEIGRPYVCEGCANDGTWRSRPLRLHVDHIDGDFENNEAENLRFLCPNCHSQTDNFSGRSRGRYSATAPGDTRPLERAEGHRRPTSESAGDTGGNDRRRATG